MPSLRFRALRQSLVLLALAGVAGSCSARGPWGTTSAGGTSPGQYTPDAGDSALYHVNPHMPVPLAGQFKVSQNVLGTTGTGLALGDCNHDGLLDLMLFQGATGPTVEIRQSDGSLGAPAPLFPSWTSPPEAGIFIDLDGDGNMDLLLAQATPAPSGSPPSSADVTFLKGRGDCTFQAAKTLASGLSGWVSQLLVTDVDLDGVPDIAVAHALTMAMSEEPPPVSLFLGRGDGAFVETPVPVTPLVPGHYSPFGTFWDDFDGDGVRDYFSILDTSMAFFSWGVHGDVPAFQRDDTISAAVSNGDAMSVAALDYDRDGHLDYFVSHYGQFPLLMRFQGRQMTNQGLGAYLWDDDLVEGTEFFGVYPFDADLDGWTDLLAVRISPSGDPQPAVFWHNNRDGTFINATKQVINLVVAGTRLICGDILSNGKVVCYADPETVDPPVAISNEIVQVGHWIGIRLVGTVSSPEAEGARVSLSGASPPLLMYYGAHSPKDCQHDRAILMAIGDQSTAAVDITWPSGLTQHVDGLAAGTYTTITEPQVLALSKRVATANGTDAVTVTVKPQAIGAAGPVTIESSGPGQWLADAQQGADGSWTRVLQAPNTPGSTRLQVGIGGQPLLVRPRVTFLAP